MHTVRSRLKEIGISPTVNVPSPDLGPPLAKALADAGIPCIEVLNRRKTADTLKTVEEITQTYPEILIGVGTVMSRRSEPMTIEIVEQFRRAGAQFFVSPVLEPDLVSAAMDRDILFIPSAETHSEVAAAERCGVSVVKIYPLNSKASGAQYLSHLNDIFQDRVSFVPTGGIGFGNKISFADVSKLRCVLACATGLIATPQLIEAGDFDTITKNAAVARAEFFKHRPK
jgi:2-dehydro-3-deoxyphosphogluconate aldolase / (4S)-4-hydroxy-2-oxoglutarate aldolase